MEENEKKTEKITQALQGNSNFATGSAAQQADGQPGEAPNQTLQGGSNFATGSADQQADGQLGEAPNQTPQCGSNSTDGAAAQQAGGQRGMAANQGLQGGSERKSGEGLRIDVGEVLRERLGRRYRFVPRWVVRWLERTICQEQMNGFLERHGDKRDGEFCRALINDELALTVDFKNEQALPAVDNRRVLFVSNHPLGALDGMILIDYIERRYGSRIGFVVNDLLSAVKPLEGVFLPINKHGRQSREAVQAVDEFFDSDNPIIMFPAGLCSRRGKKGVVADLEWQKMFVTKARKTGRLIIPLHFYGENSSFFYKFAKIRKNIGVKFNVEMVYLPRELFRARGKHFDVVFGKPIELSEFPTEMTDKEIARQIRERVYAL